MFMHYPIAPAGCTGLIKMRYIRKNLTAVRLLRRMLALSGMTARLFRACSYFIIPTHIYTQKEERVMHTPLATSIMMTFGKSITVMHIRIFGKE